MNGKSFVAGTLMSKLIAATQRAIQSGALKSISCDTQVVMQADIPFQVRILPSQKQKNKAIERLEKAGNSDVNPFLPYEAAMYVTQLTTNRIVLLNKFNVVPHHALIVSTQFEHQTNPLGKEDFYALCLAMNEFPSMGFYNGGKEAGASQAHRHLQLIPDVELGGDLPLNYFVLKNTDIPYMYCSIYDLSDEPIHRSEQLLNFYKHSLDELKLRSAEGLKPYNLLVYKNWAVVIPRRVAGVSGISINSLGYAGCFLAKDLMELEAIKKNGCLELLKNAGVEAN